MFGVTVKNAFRLYDRGADKWYLLVSGSATQRQRWMQAFEDERQRVATDRVNGFSVDAMKRPVFTKKMMKRVRPNRQQGCLLFRCVVLVVPEIYIIDIQHRSIIPSSNVYPLTPRVPQLLPTFADIIKNNLNNRFFSKEVILLDNLQFATLIWYTFWHRAEV